MINTSTDKYMVPVTIPPMANPLPLKERGSFFICERAIKPVINAAGDSSRPVEQHQPTVMLATPRQSDVIASVCVGVETANGAYSPGWPCTGCACQGAGVADRGSAGQAAGLVTRASFIMTVGGGSAANCGGGS